MRTQIIRKFRGPSRRLVEVTFSGERDDVLWADDFGAIDDVLREVAKDLAVSGAPWPTVESISARLSGSLEDVTVVEVYVGPAREL